MDTLSILNNLSLYVYNNTCFGGRYLIRITTQKSYMVGILKDMLNLFTSGKNQTIFKICIVFITLHKTQDLFLPGGFELANYNNSNCNVKTATGTNILSNCPPPASEMPPPPSVHQFFS